MLSILHTKYDTKASALDFAVTQSMTILDEVECSRFLTTFHNSAVMNLLHPRNT
jgi:hypothetical protein